MSNGEFMVGRRAILAGLGAGVAALAVPQYASAADPKRVVLLMAGGIADGGWNTLAYRGLMELSEMEGFETAYVENVTQSRCPECGAWICG